LSDLQQELRWRPKLARFCVLRYQSTALLNRE